MNSEGKLKQRLLERRRKETKTAKKALKLILPPKAMELKSRASGRVRVADAGRGPVGVNPMHPTLQRKLLAADSYLTSLPTPRAVGIRAAVVGDIGATSLNHFQGQV